MAIQLVTPIRRERVSVPEASPIPVAGLLPTSEG
jgi:hypothetical protein